MSVVSDAQPKTKADVIETRRARKVIREVMLSY
jgi:hypothetical protein